MQEEPLSRPLARSRVSRLSLHIRTELAQLWSEKKMVPTLTSRREWSKIRGVQASRISAWFVQRKFNDKKAGKPVSDETYDLSLDIPDYILATNERFGVKGEMSSSPLPMPIGKRVNNGRNDSVYTRMRLDDRHTPPPDSDDTLVASSPLAPHSIPQTRKKYVYSPALGISPISKSSIRSTESDQTSPTTLLDTYIPELSSEPATKFVYPPDDLLLPFIPDQDQVLCTLGIHSGSETSSNFVCPLCSLDVSNYSEIPGSTNLDSLAYMLSCVDPNTKEITSDYKALSTLPTSDFASIAFEYHLPAVYSDDPELESNSCPQDVDLSFEDQIGLFLPRNDANEIDLSWVDRWKQDSVFMLVEHDEEVESIVKSESDKGESGELGVDNGEDRESDADGGWLPEQREWVSVTLTI